MTLLPTIRLLDETTINQIAAGEVIESAASLIKELVENALDSGALTLTVETKAAGRAYISVRDDGCGMSHDDVLLCIERHATSKLIQIDDLYRLDTLGFRGEALSSIASVSKMKIHSAREKDLGTSLVVEGGKVVKVEKAPRTRGTTVEVTSLFFNVPARKNFQKSVAADAAEIHKVLLCAALSYPARGFEWIADGKRQFLLSPSHSLFERMEMLLGKEFAEGCLPVEEREFHGFIGKPAVHKPNRSSQYLFINQRSVYSSFVSKVLQEGYGQRIPEKRFPLFVLHLRVDPQTVDVNIHPRKMEVKLGNEESLRRHLLGGVKKTLEKAYQPLQTVAAPPPVHPQPLFFTKQGPKEPPPPLTPLPLLDIPLEVFFHLGPYCVVKREEQILFVDMQRARQRLFFDKAISRKKPTFQSLLIPLVIEKSPLECRLLEKNLPLLNDIGISIRPFGTSCFCIDALADHLSENEVELLLEAAISEEEVVKKMSGTLKFRSLNRRETEAVLKALFLSQENRFCPQGKPIFFPVTEKEIAKWLE